MGARTDGNLFNPNKIHEFVCMRTQSGSGGKFRAVAINTVIAPAYESVNTKVCSTRSERMAAEGAFQSSTAHRTKISIIVLLEEVVLLIKPISPKTWNE